MQNQPYLLTAVVTLVLVSYLGIRSKRQVSSAAQFVVGGRSFSSFQVAASIIGTLVGGAATIGTAQTAFASGANGIWFTLGSGAGCLFLGLFLAKPLRQSNVTTAPEYIEKYYGKQARVISSLVSSFAIFVHIAGQILAAVAIFTTLLHIGKELAMGITVVLILTYILFGGFLGSSVIGKAKTMLLYSTLIFSFFVVWRSFNGWSGVVEAFPDRQWFSIFRGGIFANLAQGFSLVVGVCATQTYLQAIFAGKDVKTSKRGAYISAVMIPPIGAIAVFIGMFMRANQPNIESSQALPMFILNYLNPVIGGVAIATLIISVVSTAAGLILGISTMFSRDIYKEYINSEADDCRQLRFQRMCVMVIIALSLAMVMFNLDSLILEWAFLSMTLRGVVIFIPIMAAVLLKGRAPVKAGTSAMIIGPLLTVIFHFTRMLPLDPLYAGCIISLFIYLMFGTAERRKISVKSTRDGF